MGDLDIPKHVIEHNAIGVDAGLIKGKLKRNLDVSENSLVFRELSDGTPDNPDANGLKLYSKDDGAGATRIYTLDSDGIETDLTGGGGGATALTGLTDVDDALDYTAGNIFQATGSTYTGGSYSHTLLYNIGTNTHTQVDSHISNISNPHTVTIIQVSGVSISGAETIYGEKTFSDFPFTPSSTPGSDYHVTNKAYVDSIALGLKIKASCLVATTVDVGVLSGLNTIDGINVVENNRVLVKNQVAGEYNGIYDVHSGITMWDRSSDYDKDNEVTQGTFTPIISGTTLANTQWILVTSGAEVNITPLEFTQLSAQQNYTASAGVEKVGLDFRADLNSAGAIGLAGSELKVNVDNSSVEIASNNLQVKALGVTNAMLAGTIADSKLSQITTANKVSTVAVSGLLEAHNVGTGTSGTAVFLRGDRTWATPTGGGSSYAADTMFDIDIVSSPQTAQVWTNQPIALTEVFGNTFNRQKAELTNATQYRLIATQSVGGASGAWINAQYSLNNSTFNWFDGTGVAGSIAVSGTYTSPKIGSWINIPDAAKTDVWMRIAGSRGNGVLDPAWRQLRMQFKVPGAIASGGNLNHAVLSNLDYANSAHTGFMSAGSMTGIVITTSGTVGSIAYGSNNYVLTMSGGSYYSWNHPGSVVSGLNIYSISTSGTNLYGTTISGANFRGTTTNFVTTNSTNISGTTINATASYTGAYLVGGTAIGGFVDRGDAAANDFTLADLTADSAYHDLDLSSIVPAGAKAVVLKLAIMDTATTNRILIVRKNGNTNAINIFQTRTQVANIYNDTTGIIPCDSSRVIEYSVTTGTDFAVIHVLGWFI